MNQPSPICVLYLSDASNNEENGRMKRENSDDHTHFSVPQNFFYPHKDKNTSLQRQLHFLSTKTRMYWGLTPLKQLRSYHGGR